MVGRGDDSKRENREAGKVKCWSALLPLENGPSKAVICTVSGASVRPGHGGDKGHTILAAACSVPNLS